MSPKEKEKNTQKKNNRTLNLEIVPPFLFFCFARKGVSSFFCFVLFCFVFVFVGGFGFWFWFFWFCCCVVAFFFYRNHKWCFHFGDFILRLKRLFFEYFSLILFSFLIFASEFF